MIKIGKHASIYVMVLQCQHRAETVVINSLSQMVGGLNQCKKQAMIDLRGIVSNWFKNQFCPSINISRLGALVVMNS